MIVQFSNSRLFTLIFMFSVSFLQSYRCLKSLPTSRRAVSKISLYNSNTPPTPPLQHPWILQFDGGSRGNPGLGGSGSAIFASDGDGKLTEVWCGYRFLGHKDITNNVAEYTGLIEGLKQGIKMKLPSLCLQGDSMLILNQVQGIYKVKNDVLKLHHQKAKMLLGKIPYVAYRHIPRAENARADALSNMAMDSTKSSSQFHNFTEFELRMKKVQSNFPDFATIPKVKLSRKTKILLPPEALLGGGSASAGVSVSSSTASPRSSTLKSMWSAMNDHTSASKQLSSLALSLGGLQFSASSLSGGSGNDNGNAQHHRLVVLPVLRGVGETLASGSIVIAERLHSSPQQEQEQLASQQLHPSAVAATGSSSPSSNSTEEVVAAEQDADASPQDAQQQGVTASTTATTTLEFLSHEMLPSQFATALRKTAQHNADNNKCSSSSSGGGGGGGGGDIGDINATMGNSDEIDASNNSNSKNGMSSVVSAVSETQSLPPTTYANITDSYLFDFLSKYKLKGRIISRETIWAASAAEDARRGSRSSSGSDSSSSHSGDASTLDATEGSVVARSAGSPSTDTTNSSVEQQQQQQQQQQPQLHNEQWVMEQVMPPLSPLPSGSSSSNNKKNKAKTPPRSSRRRDYLFDDPRASSVTTYVVELENTVQTLKAIQRINAKALALAASSEADAAASAATTAVVNADANSNANADPTTAVAAVDATNIDMNGIGAEAAEASSVVASDDGSTGDTSEGGSAQQPVKAATRKSASSKSLVTKGLVALHLVSVESLAEHLMYESLNGKKVDQFLFSWALGFRSGVMFSSSKTNTN